MKMVNQKKLLENMHEKDLNLDKDILLKVENLHTYFFTPDGVVRAVNGVDFEIKKGEVLGLIGETGCGKSVTAFSILKLVTFPGRIIKERILYRYNEEKVIDIIKLHPMGDTIREIRGKHISMIFQEPMVSLNPVYTIGEQIIENIVVHQNVSKKEAREIAIKMLEKVGIPDPERQVDAYPHQLSGGMRQRAMIAMALVCNPKLLIADEPTTALDVTVQAQILELLKELQKTFNMSILIITHNLGVVAEIANRVAVMYLGRIMEYADVVELFDNPLHPYTKALLRSIPSLAMMGGVKRKLDVIKGDLPDPYAIIEGCLFGSRCPNYKEKCKEEPPLLDVGDQHKVRCWEYV